MVHAVVPLVSWPLGPLALTDRRAARTCSSPMPSWVSRLGSTRARTAGLAPPPTTTWPMPSTCASFWANTESAASNTRPIGSASEVSARIRIGASAGLTFRYVGLLISPDGSWLRAALMAACTSRAAASMLRFRSNWRITVVAPSRLGEVISDTPAIRPNWRSSGVATDEAIVSGLAPGRTATTWMTGNSTCGRDDTGSVRYATMPASSSATLSSVVPIGRLMNGSAMFMTIARLLGPGRGRQRVGSRRAAQAQGEPVEGQVHDRRRVEGQELREKQPADDRDAERAPQLGAGAGAEGQGQAAQERRQRRHHDRPEAEQARLIDRRLRRAALVALSVEGEVDHHDGVLLHDTNEENDPDESDDVERRAAELQGQDRADARRRQRREDRDRVDVALVEHTQHDVDGDEGGEDQDGLVGERGLEGLRGALEARVHRQREPDLALGGPDRGDGVAQRRVRRQVEGERDRGELPLVVDGERR